MQYYIIYLNIANNVHIFYYIWFPEYHLCIDLIIELVSLKIVTIILKQSSLFDGYKRPYVKAFCK